MLHHNPFLRYMRPGTDHTNPFTGPLADAIQYDYINCHLVQERVNAHGSEILPTYECAASYLVDHLQPFLQERSVVLDLGSGTGIASRMLARVHRGKILGVEQAPAMIEVAQYKFHKSNASEFENKVKELFGGALPERLENYWQEVRAETRSAPIEFIPGDMRNCFLQVSGAYDAAIANHSLHWLRDDWPVFFHNLAAILKKGAPLVWNTASDFVDSAKFPSADYSWRYGTFMERVAEKLLQRGFSVNDWNAIRIPAKTEDEVRQIVEDNGFSCAIQEPILMPKDMRYIIGFYLPLHIAGLLVKKQEIDTIDKLSREITAELVRERSDIFADLEHRFDVNPVFVCLRK
ncbi:MAG: class I SAM-dependent methyltransferase [Nanoarchaeota archaeon]|nr:class I SAM-dependent methyltransferase [Nanoarchaeota archaeon]